MSVVTIMQPAYLPWLGFFDRIQLSDHLIILDHVAIDKNSKTKFANRNRIGTANGAQWLTVPILVRGPNADVPLNKISLSREQNWVRKHIASLRGAYGKARFFDDYFPAISAILTQDVTRLISVTEQLNRYFMDQLGITTRVDYSSTMSPESTKSDLIVELCRKAGATQYISGPFGRDYLDGELFDRHNIKLKFHDYRHPQYNQHHKGDFVPYLSIVDLLFNHGPDARDILSTDRSQLSGS